MGSKQTLEELPTPHCVGRYRTIIIHKLSTIRYYYIVLNLNLSACICNILFHLDGPNLNRSRTGPKSGKISDVTKRLDVSNKQFKTKNHQHILDYVRVFCKRWEKIRNIKHSIVDVRPVLITLLNATYTAQRLTGRYIKVRDKMLQTLLKCRW